MGRHELRKGLVGCGLSVANVTRCCFRGRSDSVGGAVQWLRHLHCWATRESAQDRGVAQRRDGRLVIRSLGLGLGDLKEHHILNRTLRWCRDGLVFAADVRHAKEVIEEFEAASSKPLSSPVVSGQPVWESRGQPATSG